MIMMMIRAYVCMYVTETLERRHVIKKMFKDNFQFNLQQDGHFVDHHYFFSNIQNLHYY